MNQASPVPVATRDDLVAILRALGLKPGDLAIFHSSLKSFGRLEGGAQAAVEACLAAVAPGGTVMMPSFNHGQREAFADIGCIFDLKTTRSVSGAITERFRAWPGVRRSLHPSHPYLALGPMAEWLTAEHFELDCFDARSPLGKLCASNGWIVLLGCGMRACTAAHVAQTIYGVPCIGQRQNPWPVRLPDSGRIVTGYTVVWRDSKCPFEFEAVERRLRETGALKERAVGAANVQAFRGADCIAACLDLCHSHCPACAVRPKYD